MDIDASFQTDFLASPTMFGAARRNLAENLQMSGGLMRYHSAPSSEFARFLSDDFDLRPAHRAGNAPVGSAMNVMKEQQCSDECRSVGQQSQYMGVRGSNLTEDVCGPLSAIFEVGLEEALDSFCSAQLPVLGNQQVAQSGGQNTMDTGSHNPPLMSCSNFARLPQAKSNLVRHSSSPADILSRLVMEEISEKPISHFAGSYVQPAVENMPEGNSLLATAESLRTATSFSTSTCFSAVSSTSKAHDDFVVGGGSLASPSGQDRTGLLRQFSSPAGLLSQLSLDGISPTGEKVSVPSSSGYSSDEGTFDRGAGASLMANYAGGNWDEVGTGLAIENFAAFAQRKRGRGIEAKMLQGLMETDSLKCAAEHQTVPSNHFSVPVRTSPGSTAGIDLSTVDSVLCRARAKRGCATHPRSIAERVRRTKISERMRKLQELVPNMDKQTNTADMLDEAVEYVKFLQRQVQELSKNQLKCNGTCRDKGNSPLLV